MATVFIIQFNVRPEQADAFAASLPGVREQLLEVEGCTGVELFRDEGDAARFCLVERWASKQTHEAHMGRVAASGRWQQVLDQLVEPPIGSYFTDLALDRAKQ